MYIDLVALTEQYLNQPDPLTERQKVKEIISQLESSIEFLNHLIDKENDQPVKANLQKEVTAARWEIERLNKELNKVTDD